MDNREQIGIGNPLKRIAVLLLVLVTLVVLVVYIGDSYAARQRVGLYCHSLSWGMSKDQVRGILTSIGTIEWREFPIEGTETERVYVAFKSSLLDRRFGGAVILYFSDKGYYSAALPIPVGEERGLCNVFHD